MMTLMNKHRFTALLTTLLLTSLVLTGCSDAPASSSTVEEVTLTDTEAPANWSEDTHSNDVEPNYDIVFNQSEVLEFNIVIDSEDWEAMQDDLAANISSGRGNKVNEGKGNRQPLNDPPANDDKAPKTDQQSPPNSNLQNQESNLVAPLNDASESSFDPIWVASSVTFNDTTWDHVGIRYKGNSSLTSAYSSGVGKLSFKLDFDEFEDLYPEINNQRFYGFKQLNLNNNYSDASLMREKIGADLFREFGLVAAQTTYAIVNVDYGQGSEFFGVYTLVEEMDDTGIESQYDEDSGNLYKPDGTAASFASGTYNAQQMEKKNNEDVMDYSDVEALYQVINSDLRLTDTDVWKSHLEEVFNVDFFLKWLAANTIIQNWDTYGNMTHNYYLYNNPDTESLEWIPWDNNEAFSSGKGRNGALSLSLDETNDQWPLISYLIDDPDYKSIYDGYLEAFIEDVFTEEKMTETYNDAYDLLKAYAYEERSGYTFINSDEAFDAAVETLKAHVVQRTEAVRAYLGN